MAAVSAMHLPPKDQLIAQLQAENKQLQIQVAAFLRQRRERSQTFLFFVMEALVDLATHAMDDSAAPESKQQARLILQNWNSTQEMVRAAALGISIPTPPGGVNGA